MFDLAVVEGEKWPYFEDIERSMAQLESLVIQTLFDLYRAWGLTPLDFSHLIFVHNSFKLLCAHHHEYEAIYSIKKNTNTRLIKYHYL